MNYHRNKKLSHDYITKFYIPTDTQPYMTTLLVYPFSKTQDCLEAAYTKRYQYLQLYESCSK